MVLWPFFKGKLETENVAFVLEQGLHVNSFLEKLYEDFIEEKRRIKVVLVLCYKFYYGIHRTYLVPPQSIFYGISIEKLLL